MLVARLPPTSQACIGPCGRSIHATASITVSMRAMHAAASTTFFLGTCRQRAFSSSVHAAPAYFSMHAAAAASTTFFLGGSGQRQAGSGGAVRVAAGAVRGPALGGEEAEEGGQRGADALDRLTCVQR